MSQISKSNFVESDQTKPNWLSPPGTVRAVLCYITRGEECLLLLKSKGRFGEGFWNAPGGKIEANEDMLEAVKREVLEETGLDVIEAKQVGFLEFYFGKEKNLPDWVAFVFICSKFSGSLVQSAEGELRWWNKSSLPFDQMWADDKYWIPLLMQGKKFRGTFVFSNDSKKLLEHSVTS